MYIKFEFYENVNNVIGHLRSELEIVLYRLLIALLDRTEKGFEIGRLYIATHEEILLV